MGTDRRRLRRRDGAIGPSRPNVLLPYITVNCKTVTDGSHGRQPEVSQYTLLQNYTHNCSQLSESLINKINEIVQTLAQSKKMLEYS